jgi:tetratricopeptide (TPR) repeat protein
MIEDVPPPFALDLTRPMEGDTPETLYSLGHMLHAAGDHEGALDAYTRLAKTHPRTHVFYDQAIQFRALRRYEESLTPLALVLSTEPLNFMAWVNAADSMRHMNQLEGAAKLFRKAVAVAEEVGKPKTVALACHNLSVTLWDLCDYDGARAEAERAVDLAPFENHYRAHLASLQLVKDDYAAGWGNYNARFGIDPDGKAERLVDQTGPDAVFKEATAAQVAEPQLGRLTTECNTAHTDDLGRRNAAGMGAEAFPPTSRP